MSTDGKSTTRLTRLGAISLTLGVLVPVIYFAALATARAFYPGFSFVRRWASEMGAADAPHPHVLNVGLMALGVVTLLSVYGFWRGLRAAGAGPVATRWTCIVVVGFAVAMFMAGRYPMPDWLHFGFGLSFLLLVGPAIMSRALSKRDDAGGLRRYLLLTNAAMVVLVFATVSAGRGPFRGVCQLGYSLAAIPWIGVSAYKLLRLSRGGSPGGYASDETQEVLNDRVCAE
jgi:hypothetical membrane protein